MLNEQDKGKKDKRRQLKGQITITSLDAPRPRQSENQNDERSSETSAFETDSSEIEEEQVQQPNI